MKFAALLSALFLGSAQSFVPHKVSHSDLVNPSAGSQRVFQDGLSQVGLISVTDIPGFAELRENMLSASAKCALKTKSSNQAGNFEFEDGTTRLTIGAQTVNGVSADMEGPELDSPACMEFNSMQQKFRDVVDSTMSLFIDTLDKVQAPTSRKLMLDTETGLHMESLKEVVKSGTHLEHFHTYEKFQNTHRSAPTLDLHVDQGLFIAFSPALNLVGDSTSHGFKIELANGDVVEPDFGEGNNELVFMIGDGFTQFLNSKMSVPLRATPHQMTMPEGTDAAVVRSWYGRMVLPKNSAYLETHGKTYGEMMSSATEQGNVSDMAVCSPGNSLNMRLLQQCGENETFCWHNCLANPTCPEGQLPSCKLQVLGHYIDCPDSVHSCSVVCI